MLIRLIRGLEGHTGTDGSFHYSVKDDFTPLFFVGSSVLFTVSHSSADDFCDLWFIIILLLSAGRRLLCFL